MAARFFINGGVNNLWSNTGNWSTTSGGAGGSAIPTAADTVTLDTNSPNCTVDEGAARNCLTFTATSYTNTLTLKSTLRAAGTYTFGSGMQPILGNGTFRFDVTATITCNGIVIPNAAFNTTATITLADPMVVSNLVVVQGNPVVTLNGSTLTIKGYLFISPIASSTFPTLQGTTVINLNNYNGDYLVVGTLSNTLNIQKPTRGY